MQKWKILFVLISLVVLPTLLSAQTKVHHVLFAITSGDEKDWALTIGNIANLKKGLAPDVVEVEVVAYGPAVTMLKNDSSVAAEIKQMIQDRVHVVACENSMKRMGLTKANLTLGVDTVPSGIVEVVRREEAGWTYVKAGR